MSHSSPSSNLLHMWIVTGIQYTIVCSISWYATFRLLSGFSGGSKSSVASRCSAIRTLTKNQMLSVLVCLGYSVGLPMQCVQMFYIDLAYDQAKRSDDGKDTMFDHMNWRFALGFGIPGNLLMFSAALVAIYINMERLDIFDSTILEMSETKKKRYRRQYFATVFLLIIWLGWFSFYEYTPVAFALYTLLCLLDAISILFLLTFEFGSRLGQFLEIVQLDDELFGSSTNDVGCPARSLHNHTSNTLTLNNNTSSNRGSHNAGSSISINSRMTTETNLSEDDIYLLRVIIKQSLLSIIVLCSLFINGMMLVMAILLTEGVINAYARVGVTQVGAVITLCGYLSYEFANRDYESLCQWSHRWIEDRAVATMTSPSPSSDSTPRTPNSACHPPSSSTK